MPHLPKQVRLVLRILAAQQQLSHADLAEASGLHKTTITRTLTGERKLTMESLQAFAVALKMRASRILVLAERLAPTNTRKRHKVSPTA
jgi:transcriptional regulator with XRE-family HTH domain